MTRPVIDPDADITRDRRRYRVIDSETKESLLVNACDGLNGEPGTPAVVYGFELIAIIRVLYLCGVASERIRWIQLDGVKP